jgi:hypothetical protein
MQNKLTLPIYLLKIGKLKNKQSIYKEIRKNGAEGWAMEIFDLLLNDFEGLQEIRKEILHYNSLLEMGITVNAFLSKK